MRRSIQRLVDVARRFRVTGPVAAKNSQPGIDKGGGFQYYPASWERRATPPATGPVAFGEVARASGSHPSCSAQHQMAVGILPRTHTP